MTTAYVRRRCTFEHGSHHPHVWERLHLDLRRYRRGRVIFFCTGWLP